MKSEHSRRIWQQLARPIAIWLGSFIAVAAVLLVYYRIPVGPLLIGGGATLLGTIVRVVMSPRPPHVGS